MKKNSRDTAGDCISHPEHGAATALSSGRLWCGHQTHDREAGGTPWLDSQKAPGEEGTDPNPEPVTNDPAPVEVVVPTDTGFVKVTA